MVRVDGDGLFFVDYLGYDPLDGYLYLHDYFGEIWMETRKDLEAATGERVRQKLVWLRDYITSSMHCMLHPKLRLQQNVETPFAARFPRTEDSARSWVDA